MDHAFCSVSLDKLALECLTRQSVAAPPPPPPPEYICYLLKMHGVRFYKSYLNFALPLVGECKKQHHVKILLFD